MPKLFLGVPGSGKQKARQLEDDYNSGGVQQAYGCTCLRLFMGSTRFGVQVCKMMGAGLFFLGQVPLNLLVVLK